MLNPKAVIVGVVVVVVLPLWIAAAWVAGLIPIGAEPSTTGRAAVFEQTSARGLDQLRVCLQQNYSGWLTLTSARSPPGKPQTTRLHNRVLHMVVEISPEDAGGSIVRVFKLNSAPLSQVHVRAIQSCIPENGFPPAADPRNREFYSDGG